MGHVARLKRSKCSIGYPVRAIGWHSSPALRMARPGYSVHCCRLTRIWRHTQRARRSRTSTGSGVSAVVGGWQWLTHARAPPRGPIRYSETLDQLAANPPADDLSALRHHGIAECF